METKQWAEHSPTPWRWGEDWEKLDGQKFADCEPEKYMDLRLVDRDGYDVIPIRVDHREFIYDGDLMSPENRAFIVTACSNFDEMKTLLERIISDIERGSTITPGHKLFDVIRALLAKLEGTQ